jgi:hypothetical protein
MYNTSTTPQTGLFDVKIHVNNEANDIYHFLCTYTKDDAHTATCTLTYEEPARKQGPALVTIRFRDVKSASSANNLPEGSCTAASATIVGNYFYDSEMVAAGAYSFYVPGNASLRKHARHSCEDRFPILQDTVTFSGCTRNMIKNTTTSVETCQNGWMTMYNTSTTPQTGLFDAKIHVNNEANDIYHFLCTLTQDDAHTATCTLTYEEPARTQGPALVTIRFRDVSVVDPTGDLPEGSCTAASATIIGNYFYDSEMVAAGAYSFYVPSNTSLDAPAKALSYVRNGTERTRGSAVAATSAVEFQV